MDVTEILPPYGRLDDKKGKERETNNERSNIIPRQLQKLPASVFGCKAEVHFGA